MSSVTVCDLCGDRTEDLGFRVPSPYAFDEYDSNARDETDICVSCTARPIAELAELLAARKAEATTRLREEHAERAAAWEEKQAAPFGRDEDGTPKAPHGYTKAGTVRLKPVKETAP